MRAICVAGGPGFNPAYLLHAAARSLDGPVSAFEASGDFTYGLNALVRHLAEADAAGPFVIVAHSWGSLLTTAALQTSPGLRNLAHTVLINPVPMTRREFQAMASAFRSRIPLRTKCTLLMHAFQGNAAGVMRALMPYYGITPNDAVLTELALNLRAYREGMRRVRWLGSTGLQLTGRACTVIRGQHDITAEGLLSPLLTCATSLTVLEGSGHFPMYDNPDGFSRALGAALH